jgi:hypothetical protein
MIFEELANRLKADTQIAALVGARIWFVAAPAGQPYPDIIQYPSSGEMMEENLEGVELPWRRRVSFECRGQVYGGTGGVHELGEHVIRVLNNLSGVVGNEQIQMCRLVSDVPDYDETSAIRRRIIDFRVVHAPA